MALSEANQIKLAQIFGLTPLNITDQLQYVGTRFTAAVQSAVEAQIVLWDAGAGTKTTKIHAKESNRGVETRPEQARADIKRNIAGLLERPDWASMGSGAEFTMERG